MVSHAFSATVLATLIAAGASAQTPISFDREYSGRIDCAFIGNSHSVVPYPSSYCPTLDETTANLAMPAGATVVSATIYWSTSGDNDRWIKLNGEWVESEQTWDQEIGGNNLRFYGQKADVTSIVSAAGSGEYEVDRLDFDTYPYCQSGAAYGGWAMLVVYEDASLPLTEIDVFEGFIGVFNAYGSGNGEIETTLTGLHFPTECAVHATFKHLSWDGDAYKTEKFFINDHLLGNNTFNGSTAPDLDIDSYDISGLVDPGDTSIEVRFENFLVSTSYGNAIEYAPHQVFLVKSEQCEECVPEISTVAPPQLPIVTDDCFTLTGDCFDEITEVKFGDTVLPAFSPEIFGSGSYEVINAQTLEICPPLCLDPNVYEIRVTTPNGTATRDVTLAEPINASLACPTSFPAGNEMCVAVSSGSTLPKPNAIFVIISPTNQPSVIPGVINAGLGNMFSEYFCGPAYITECVEECYPIPAALAGSTWYFQAIVWNPMVVQNPLFPTTNLCSATFF